MGDLRYCFDEHGVNLTLQDAARTMVASFNSMADGIDVPGGLRLRFYVMNFKGDWKFLKEMFLMKRHPGTGEAR